MRTTNSYPWYIKRYYLHWTSDLCSWKFPGRVLLEEGEGKILWASFQVQAPLPSSQPQREASGMAVWASRCLWWQCGFSLVPGGVFIEVIDRTIRLCLILWKVGMDRVVQGAGFCHVREHTDLRQGGMVKHRSLTLGLFVLLKGTEALYRAINIFIALLLCYFYTDRLRMQTPKTYPSFGLACSVFYSWIMYIYHSFGHWILLICCVEISLFFLHSLKYLFQLYSQEHLWISAYGIGQIHLL